MEYVIRLPSLLKVILCISRWRRPLFTRTNWSRFFSDWGKSGDSSESLGSWSETECRILFIFLTSWTWLHPSLMVLIYVCFMLTGILMFLFIFSCKIYEYGLQFSTIGTVRLAWKCSYSITPQYHILTKCQWRSQKGWGQWGNCPPPLAENPELHCILLLHNFKTVIN